MEKAEIAKTTEITHNNRAEKLKYFAKIAAIGWVIKAAIMATLYFSVPEVKDIVNTVKDKVIETIGFADEN